MVSFVTRGVVAAPLEFFYLELLVISCSDLGVANRSVKFSFTCKCAFTEETRILFEHDKTRNECVYLLLKMEIELQNLFTGLLKQAGSCKLHLLYLSERKKFSLLGAFPIRSRT